MVENDNSHNLYTYLLFRHTEEKHNHTKQEIKRNNTTEYNRTEQKKEKNTVQYNTAPQNKDKHHNTWARTVWGLGETRVLQHH